MGHDSLQTAYAAVGNMSSTLLRGTPPLHLQFPGLITMIAGCYASPLPDYCFTACHAEHCPAGSRSRG